MIHFLSSVAHGHFDSTCTRHNYLLLDSGSVCQWQLKIVSSRGSAVGWNSGNPGIASFNVQEAALRANKFVSDSNKAADRKGF